MPALLSADIPAPHLCLALGVITAAFASLEGSKRARLATLVALCPVTGLCLLYENELTSLEYRTALRRSFKHRVGRYYMSTAGRRVLENSELRLTYERL